MAKRERRVAHGDFPEDDSMADVIDRFRSEANLIESAPDRSLLRFAHESGWDRPGASEVREAWAIRNEKPPPSEREQPQMDLDMDRGRLVPPREVEPLRGDSTEPESPEIERSESEEGEVDWDDLGCLHPRTIEIDDGEAACELCGVVISPSLSAYDECDHDWEMRQASSMTHAEDRGDVVRICNFCTKCNHKRRCPDGAHRALVEAGEMVYCSTCGQILSTVWVDRVSPGFREEETIHHPALTNTEELRVEDTTVVGDFDNVDVMSEQELLDAIDKEILY